MPITIPRSQVASVLRLLNASEPDFNALRGALSEGPPAAALETVANRVATRTGWSVEAATDIVALLISMYLTACSDTQADKEQAIGAFSRDVAQRIEAQAPNDVQIKANDAARLEVRLRELLSQHATLGVTARAIDIRVQYDETFHDARIFTDARPIFAPANTLGPNAFAVVHILRITAHESSDLRTHSVALGSGDLRRLKDVIDRAIAKESSLKTALRTAHFEVLE